MSSATATVLLELAISSLFLYVVGCIVANLWVTRRQPVRKHGPTGNDPWLTPGQLHRYRDNTPVR